MAVDLSSLVAPDHTAVVTSEVQNGVVGEHTPLPALAEQAKTMIPELARLVRAARAAGVTVVHGVYQVRPDGRGSNSNARLFRFSRQAPVKQLPSTGASEVVAEIGVEDSDIVMARGHGLNPISGTDMEPVLRNLGVRTLVVTGVSVNVAVTNMVMEAVNRGFEVVVARDAVAGVPAEYADAVIDNTLSFLATLTTVDDLIAAWT
jgi:biuret amidohydrolase